MTTTEHPVAVALRAAYAGRYPAVDGGYEVVPPWRPDVTAVVAFTGHAFLAVPADVRVDFEALGVDGFGGAHRPPVAVALTPPGGRAGSLDVVLLTTGRGDPDRPVALVPRPDLAGHDRARYATTVRDDVRVYGRPAGDDLVTVGRGIGGLTELGIETAGTPGAGATLLADALTLVASDDVVAASVAPGNARALRTFLAAGFVPLASVQLITTS